MNTQLSRHFADHPSTESDLGGSRLVANLQLIRVKAQAVHQHCHIAINRIAARLQQTNAAQGHIQFLSYQHAERGMHALSHFTARHGQHHTPIGGDLDPAVQGDAGISLVNCPQLG